MGRSPEAAEQLRALVAGGSIGIGVMTTDDCHQAYKELLDKGVVFQSEPVNRPYGSRPSCATTRATRSAWYNPSPMAALRTRPNEALVGHRWPHRTAPTEPDRA